MDVGTGIALYAASEVSQDAVKRMLGPAADYIGEGGRGLAERVVENWRAVFGKATRKLGDQLNEDGAIPPKVLRAVVDEAATAEDELVQDYLAGVLASARSENGRDDRAAAHARLVGDLSNYALRTHYVLYAAAQRHAKPEDERIVREGFFSPLNYFMTTEEFVAGLALSDTEVPELMSIMADTMFNLHQRGLIGDFRFGAPEHLRASSSRDFPDHGLIFGLTQFGILFLSIACGTRKRFSEAWVGDPSLFALESGPALPRVFVVDELPPWVEPSPETATSS